MRAYISGGITGVENYMDRFETAEKELYRRFGKDGVKVFNPAKISAGLPVLEHSEYMQFSFLEMAMCDTVFFLPGWEKSRGANQEMGFAIARGMNIHFLEGKG